MARKTAAEEVTVSSGNYPYTRQEYDALSDEAHRERLHGEYGDIPKRGGALGGGSERVELLSVS